MRWPVVSRSEYDRVIEISASYLRERDRLAELLADLCKPEESLKRQIRELEAKLRVLELETQLKAQQESKDLPELPRGGRTGLKQRVLDVAAEEWAKRKAGGGRS